MCNKIEVTVSSFKQMPNHVKVRALLWILAIKQFHNKLMKEKASGSIAFTRKQQPRFY